MTSDSRIEEIRGQVDHGFMNDWDDDPIEVARELLAELDRVTRERDEAQRRVDRVKQLRDQYRKMSPRDQVSVASVEAYLAVIVLDAVSGPVGTPEEPAEKLLRDIFTDPAERVRPEDLKAAEAAGSMRAWDETDVELESAVSGGTAQDEARECPYRCSNDECEIDKACAECLAQWDRERDSARGAAQDDAQTEGK